MTLTERMTCTVRGCERRKAPDATVCADDLRDLWANRLHREADGTYTRRRLFVARELSRAA